MVVNDWGVLEVVLGKSMSLPEAAETIHRLAVKRSVPHDKIPFDKLGIGRNFPNHLVRWGITMAIPYAGEGKPQDPSSFVNLRTEAGWKLRNRLDATHLVYEPPGSLRGAWGHGELGARGAWGHGELGVTGSLGSRGAWGQTSS